MCGKCVEVVWKELKHIMFFISVPANQRKKLIETLSVAKPTRDPEKTPKSFFNFL